MITMLLRHLIGDHALHAEIDSNATSGGQLQQMAREQLRSDGVVVAARSIEDDREVWEMNKRIRLVQGAATIDRVKTERESAKMKELLEWLSDLKKVESADQQRIDNVVNTLMCKIEKRCAELCDPEQPVAAALEPAPPAASV